LAYAEQITNPHRPSSILLLKTINKGLGVTLKASRGSGKACIERKPSKRHLMSFRRIK